MANIKSNKILFISFVIFIFLFGCVEQVKKQRTIEIPESYNINITSEYEEINKVKLPILPTEENGSINLEQIANYTKDENATLNIVFFNIGPDQRLDLISKGDFDVAIVSINADKIDEASALLKSKADDIEILILPYAKTAVDSLKIKNKIDVAKIIVPDYELLNITSPNVEKMKSGDNIKENGITITFITPFKGAFSGYENNALSFYLNDRNFSIFFGNDIVEGAIGKIVSSNLALKTDVVVMPSYGKGEASGQYMGLFIDRANPKSAVFEGMGIDLNRIEQNDSRVGIINKLLLKNINLYFVGNNKNVLISYNGNMYNVNENN